MREETTKQISSFFSPQAPLRPYRSPVTKRQVKTEKKRGSKLAKRAGLKEGELVASGHADTVCCHALPGQHLVEVQNRTSSNDGTMSAINNARCSLTKGSVQGSRSSLINHILRLLHAPSFFVTSASETLSVGGHWETNENGKERRPSCTSKGETAYLRTGSGPLRLPRKRGVAKALYQAPHTAMYSGSHCQASGVLQTAMQQGEICSGVMQPRLDGARRQQSKQHHQRHVGLQSDQHVGEPQPAILARIVVEQEQTGVRLK